MATCKKCGKTIDDGLEYCSECSGMGKADESYLDSLLSSVSQNADNPLAGRIHRTQTTASPITPKFSTKKKISTENYNILSDSDDDSFLDDLFDSSDIPDLPPMDDSIDPVVAAAFEGVDAPSFALDNAGEPVPEASEEEVTESPFDLPEVGEEEAEPDGAVLAENAVSEGEAEGEEPEAPEVVQDSEEPAGEQEPMSEEDSFLADLLDSVGDTDESEKPADDPIAALDEAFAIAEGNEGGLEGESGENTEDIDFFSTNASPEEIEAAKALEEAESAGGPEEGSDAGENGDAGESDAEDGEKEPTLAELGEQFDIPIIYPGAEDEKISSASDAPELDENGDPILIPADIPGEETNNGKKVKIVNDGGSEGGDEDILEFWNNINSELGDGPIIEGIDTTGGPAAPAKAAPEKELSPEEQAEQDELAALLSGLPGVDENSPGVGELEAPEEEKPKKKKKGFFQRIFGNVKEELTEEQIEERKQAALDKLDRDEAAAQKAKEDKEEEKKTKAEAAAEAKKAKAEAAAEAKKRKEEEKKAKADKKAELRKALVEEIEENEGKINKVGASLIFLVFGAIFAFIAIGTSVYTYRVAIEQARKDFDDDKYEEAYNDIYGIDVKEEDQELYDKIMVVNYVNSQLLAYLRYTGLEMENEALDSLLKGLRRYEKYIFFARELQVDEDLDFLKSEITTALSSAFGLDEEAAYAIIGSESQELYSQAVREVVDKLNN
ncbi:MAG: hypothetical protein J6113_02655 [Lachnospiraceae bacterium]|nr:hypothetical protein [Lachnospiraceae bacterium]